MALMEKKRLLVNILGSKQAVFFTRCDFSVPWYKRNNKQKHAAMLYTSITSTQSWGKICYFNIKWELQHWGSFFLLKLFKTKLGTTKRLALKNRTR